MYDCPPEYLSVPYFLSCTGSKDHGSFSTHDCLPSEKPEECPEASWYHLVCLNGMPYHGIKECTPRTLYPAHPPAPPSPSFSSAPCDAKQTATCDPDGIRVHLPAGPGDWPGVWYGTIDKHTTPGTEAIFSFTPNTTGSYTFDVCHVPGRCNGDPYPDYFVKNGTTGRDGKIWYYYKEADSCSPYDWTIFRSTYPSDSNYNANLYQNRASLIAGVTYLILIDGTDTFEKDLRFRVTCPEESE